MHRCAVMINDGYMLNQVKAENNLNFTCTLRWLKKTFFGNVNLSMWIGVPFSVQIKKKIFIIFRGAIGGPKK